MHEKEYYPAEDTMSEIYNVLATDIIQGFYTGVNLLSLAINPVIAYVYYRAGLDMTWSIMTMSGSIFLTSLALHWYPKTRKLAQRKRRWIRQAQELPILDLPKPNPQKLTLGGKVVYRFRRRTGLPLNASQKSRIFRTRNE